MCSAGEWRLQATHTHTGSRISLGANLWLCLLHCAVERCARPRPGLLVKPRYDNFQCFTFPIFHVRSSTGQQQQRHHHHHHSTVAIARSIQSLLLGTAFGLLQPHIECNLSLRVDFTARQSPDKSRTAATAQQPQAA